MSVALSLEKLLRADARRMLQAYQDFVVCLPAGEAGAQAGGGHEIRVLLDEGFEILAGHGFVLVPTAAHLN